MTSTVVVASPAYLAREGVPTTPEELATFNGQFFAYRTRGELILDERTLTHSRGGSHTVIPLAAIRDVSAERHALEDAAAGKLRIGGAAAGAMPLEKGAVTGAGHLDGIGHSAAVER